jgi:hypothetical protein
MGNGIHTLSIGLLSLAAFPANSLSISSDVYYRGYMDIGTTPKYEFAGDYIDYSATESICLNGSGLGSCSTNNITEDAELILNFAAPVAGYPSVSHPDFSGSISIHTSVGQANLDGADTRLDFYYWAMFDELVRVDYTITASAVSLGSHCLATGYSIRLFDTTLSGSCGDAPLTISGSRMLTPYDDLIFEIGAGAMNHLYTDSAGVSVDTAINFTVTAVPIPATVWLFGSGLGLLGWMKRRQTH